MNKDRLTALEKKVEELICSTVYSACMVMRRIVEDYGLLDQELEERIVDIENKIKKQHPPK